MDLLDQSESAFWLTNYWDDRKTSQKPTEELYAAFKQNFPTFPGTTQVVTSSAVASTTTAAAAVAAQTSAAPSNNATDSTLNPL
jgi:hypothetical protein